MPLHNSKQNARYGATRTTQSLSGWSQELGVVVSRSAVRGFSAARLRRYRQARKATIEDLADAAGVSPQAISAWENGRAAPTPELLARVDGHRKLPTGGHLWRILWPWFLPAYEPVPDTRTRLGRRGGVTKSAPSRVHRLVIIMLPIIHPPDRPNAKQPENTKDRNPHHCKNIRC
ncbi:helix-turn-helix domain-containing protein [Rhodococcus erythropolis]